MSQPNIKITNKSMQDIKPPTLGEQITKERKADQTEMRVALVFLLYTFGVSVALILAIIGYSGRGSEIDRLKAENSAQSSKIEELTPSPTPLPDPCGLESVVCPGEVDKPIEKVETPIKQVKPAITPSNAQNGTTKASWYDYSINGQVWSKDHRTAASREFPRGTMVEVCRVYSAAEALHLTAEDMKCVEVLINDYGPSAAVHPDRGLDLSSYAFSQLAPLSKGVITVEYRKVE